MPGCGVQPVLRNSASQGMGLTGSGQYSPGGVWSTPISSDDRM